MSKEDCIICQETLVSKHTLECKHYFCHECIVIYFYKNNPKNSGIIYCPLCRQSNNFNLSTKDISFIKNNKIIKVLNH